MVALPGRLRLSMPYTIAPGLALQRAFAMTEPTNPQIPVTRMFIGGRSMGARPVEFKRNHPRVPGAVVGGP